MYLICCADNTFQITRNWQYTILCCKYYCEKYGNNVFVINNKDNTFYDVSLNDGLMTIRYSYIVERTLVD